MFQKSFISGVEGRSDKGIFSADVYYGLTVASLGDLERLFGRELESLNISVVNRPSQPVDTSRDWITSPQSPSRQMSNSHFTISPRDAGRLVQSHRKTEDEQHCFLLQISFQTVYSDADIPNSVIKKLPRLVNGIPLGAGLMARDQLGSIRWRYIEGGRKMHTFVSKPICQEDAEETKRALKDRLVKQSHAIFGDITVKATVILSQCLNFDDDFIINDIAIPLDEGLHFRD